MSRAERCDYDRRMDVFADIGESSVLDLIAALLLMAIWSGAILAVDHWVWSDRLWPKRKAGPR
jgi:hypothetical protein